MKKKLVVGCLLPMLGTVTAVGLVFLLLSAVATSATAEFTQGYRESATMINGSWQAILAFDTVRYDNDLEDADPNLSSMEFLVIDYREYRWVPPSGTGNEHEPGHWRLIRSGTLDSSDKLRRYFDLDSDDGISELLEKMEEYEQPHPYSFTISTKTVEDVMDEFEFDEAMREWMGLLITDGILNEQFGIEVPDFIAVEGTGYLPWPLPGIPESNMTSSYGYRIHPVTGEKSFHYGTDIGCETGTPTVAIGDGSVISVGSGAFSGKYVKIQFEYDGYTWQVTYMHLSEIRCRHGESVAAGDVIALTGASGRVTGPHLHIEIMCEGAYRNPAELISGH